MRRLFISFIVSIFFLTSSFAEIVPTDNTKLNFGFYVGFYGYNLFIIKTFNSDSGQIGVETFKNDFTKGHQLDFYNGEMYFEIDNNRIEIREEKNSSDIFASGYVYQDSMVLTFDNEIYIQFTFVKNRGDSVDPIKADPFYEYRSLFEEGFTVPAGLYKIGVDLPDGAFSFSSETGCSIEIQQNNYHLFTIELDPNESYQKYILETGQWININNGSVILKTYHGLFN